MRRLPAVSLFAVLTCLMPACHVYSGAQIEGRVVDAVTKTPISGAVVAVNWDIYGGAVHGSTIGSLHMAETVTDGDGRFSLAAWGPRFLFRDGLRSGTPVLVVAHPGYYFKILSNEIEGSIVPPAFTIETRTCRCGQELVEMQPFDMDWRRIKDNAEAAQRNIPLGLDGPGQSCAWQRVPRFAEEIYRRGNELKQNNVAHHLPLRGVVESQGDCATQ